MKEIPKCFQGSNRVVRTRIHPFQQKLQRFIVHQLLHLLQELKLFVPKLNN